MTKEELMQEAKDVNIIALATKEVETEDGRKFTAYFAYRQEIVNGECVDKLTPYVKEDGTPEFKARPIKVRISEDFAKKLEGLDMQFPLLMRLDPNMYVKNSEGKRVSSFFVTVDTDKKTKQPKLDKNGKRHLILVIRDAVAIWEKPRTSYSLDDLDDFE